MRALNPNVQGLNSGCMSRFETRLIYLQRYMRRLVPPLRPIVIYGGKTDTNEKKPVNDYHIVALRELISTGCELSIRFVWFIMCEAKLGN